MSQNALFIICLLFFNIAVCEWLVARTWLKHLGTALLVIILTAVLANVGIIPSSTNAPPLYDYIFSYIAPLAIFYLLLECNIGEIRKAGLPILTMFFIGSLGTVLGVIAGAWIIGGPQNIGEFFPQVAGMFTGTYTGGSINFNAVAIEYEMNKEGNLYAGSVAIDNIWTAIWIVLTILIPKFLSRYIPRKSNKAVTQTMISEKDENDTEKVNPFMLSLLAFIGIVVFFSAEYLAELSQSTSFAIPSILILTSISLLLAQLPIIQKIRGARILGILGIYLFLAIIGAYCDLSTLPKMGDLAYHLLYFVGIVVFVHGVFIFGIGALFKQDWDIIAIASQANVGGSGSALALARSLERTDLLLPAILLGTLGNAIGTYLAFMMVAYYL